MQKPDEYRLLRIMNNHQIFSSAHSLAQHVANEFRVLSLHPRPAHIVIPGGNTPKLLFTLLSQPPYLTDINWENLHIWWSDERYVSTTSTESNFGETCRTLLGHIPIPHKQIHRIPTENSPEVDAEKYAELMQENIPLKNGIPIFDWVLLGIGEDGHTASLFPQSFHHEETALTVCTKHPSTQQDRISINANVFNNAKHITFIVTGEHKAPIIQAIFKSSPESSRYPASHIRTPSGKTEWLLDELAAKLI